MNLRRNLGEYKLWEDVLKRRPRDWLALDDDWVDWPEWCLAHYVKTHAREGLSDPAVQNEFAQKLPEMCK